ncbi:MAG TPA: MlaD family protein [Rhodanobacteraceae bacterium]
MTDANPPQAPSGPGGDLPEPVAIRRHRWTISLIWLVPLIAALIGVSLVVTAWLSAGPQIVISFQTAQGLTAGKTEVKYKNVVIGKVHRIDLSQDRTKVLVTVDLEKKAEGFATVGSRFWVVRPRIGLGGISGLGTLFSGAYIGADTGGSDEEQTRFNGLETPPPLTHSESGRSFLLTSDDLGSLDIGSPVYYRRIQVGRVVAYHLNKDGAGVTVQVFVKAPADRFVTTDTRFWNASGVDVSLGAGGLKVNTESLATVISGGIAFLAPAGDAPASSAPADARFRLFDDKTSAMRPPDGPPVALQMHFHQSVRGLKAGAPVDFLGIDLGKVTSVTLDFDPKTKHFPADVTAVIYPDRIGKANQRFEKRTGNTNPGALLGILVKHGLRAQLRTGNLLTGQLYVALDFFPKAPKVAYDPKLKPLVVPTMQGTFGRMQQQLADIVDKVHKIPFDQIGLRLDDNLGKLDAVLGQLHTKVMPEATSTLRQAKQTLGAAGKTMHVANHALSNDSPLMQNLDQTLVELRRAARSLRVLASYLSLHPESLLRGRRNDAPSVPPGTHSPTSPPTRSQP